MNGNRHVHDPPLKLSLRRKRWQYRGEGNANLVLALTEERKIVRFRKDERVLCVSWDRAVRGGADGAERERVWREARFCRGVMAPLLGECYVQPPVVAFVEPAELERIERLLSGKRPEHRHHKGLRLGFAMIYPDYALLPTGLSVSLSPPTFCVEVKPKQGWLPPSDRRLPKCTYCLTQFLKLKSGLIQARSQYCPLDLFSGCRDRMKAAIQALLFDPQNNLKIFQDGVLVYGEGAGRDLSSVLHAWFPEEASNSHKAREKLCWLVLEACTRELAQLSGGQWVDTLPMEEMPAARCAGERLPATLVASAAAALAHQKPCDWESQPLPTDCILARILDIQKLEVNGAERVYRSFRDESSSTLPRDDYSYVDAVLTSRTLTGVQRYLLATTAKDCSVMMSFQRADRKHQTPPLDPCHIVRDLDSVCYVMNVGVSDLDPKPMSCIEKHRKRDLETLIACVDQLQ